MAICILEVLNPILKTGRKLWIVSLTKLQFLRVEGRPLVVIQEALI